MCFVCIKIFRRLNLFTQSYCRLVVEILTCTLGGEGEDSPGLAGPEYVLPGDLHLTVQKQENLESVSG